MITAPVASQTPSTVRRRSVVLPVVLGLALLQALWIVSVPPFRASDEFDHAYRAAAVARGQIVVDDAPEDGRGVLVRVPVDLIEAAHDQCAALPYTGPDNCSAVAGSEEGGTALVGSGAGKYNPVFYWVVGSAALPFDGSAALYAMRIAAALLCLLFMGLAAWCLSLRDGPGWSGVGLVLALSPVFLFSTAMAAPNGLEMAAALALWCSLLVAPRVSDPRTLRRVVGVAALAAATVATLRMLGPLFVLLTVALVAAFHGRGTLRFVRRSSRLVAGASAVVAVATALAAAWTLRAGLVHGSGEPQGGADWKAKTVILWPLQTIAAFPFRDLPGPTVVYPVIGGLVVALTWAALRTARGNRRAALVLALVAALALPFVLTVVSRGGRGIMWQGRYGLPLAVGFILIAGLVLASGRRPPRARVVVPAGIALALCSTACLAKIVRAELGRAASAGDPSWWAAPTWFLALVALVAWSLLARAALPGRNEPGRTRGPG